MIHISSKKKYSEVPCHECTKRELYCHASCPDYKVYKDRIDATKKAKEADNIFTGKRYRVNNVV